MEGLDVSIYKGFNSISVEEVIVYSIGKLSLGVIIVIYLGTLLLGVIYIDLA